MLNAGIRGAPSCCEEESSRKASLSEIFIDETEVRLECVREGAAIHFTVDGTEPDESSALYCEPIRLTATTTINARAYWPDGIASRTATFRERLTSSGNLADESTAMGVTTGNTAWVKWRST